MCDINREKEQKEATQPQPSDNGILPIAGTAVRRPRSRAVSATVQLAQCAIFVALMAAAADIQIPFYPVPLTFQTVVCVLAGLLLGARNGALALTAYLVMGVLGLPVFSSGGGFTYVLMPSFGYILGFVGAAFSAGLIVGKKKTLSRFLLAAAVGFAVNYAVGIVYFILIWEFYLQAAGLGAALVTYNLLYMPKDIVLCMLAAFLARRVGGALRQR